MSQTLKVEIVGDASSYSKALDKASGATHTFGSKLGSFAKTAGLVAGGAALGGIAATLKVGIGEWTESTKVAAQTQAVLKSTGQVAGVTAGQVDKLATSLMEKSGIDDEAIKSGENLLLTFTNIRNEAGKGNDVFTQTTKIAADMSTALGQDMTTSALQLGKALNDPIKGLSALSRVGVSFTQKQKDQIRTLVETGHTMEAQKVILGELRKEFGGSAEAAGKTLPGQLKILREEFNNVAGDVVGKLIPAFAGLVAWVTAHWGQISEAIKGTFTVIQSTISGVAGFISEHTSLFVGLAGAIGGAVIAMEAFRVATTAAMAAQVAFNLVAEANPYVLVATAVLAAASALGVLYFENQRVHDAVDQGWAEIKATFETVLPYLQQLWATFGGTLIAIAKNYWALISGQFQAALLELKGIFNVFGGLLQGDWGRVWQGLTQIFGGFVKQFTTVAETFKDQVVLIFRTLGNLIRTSLDAAMDALAGIARAGFTAMVSAIRSLAGAAGNAAESVAAAILNGIVSGLRALGSRLLELIVAPINAVIGKINAIQIPGFSFDVDTHLPGVGHVGFSFPGFDPIPGNIPTLAAGGIITKPMLAMLGERGREAVIPLDKAKGYGGGMTVNVTVPGTLVGSGGMKELAAAIRKELQRYGRDNAINPLAV